MKNAYHHKDLRQQLIKSGLRLLTREGLASFSMRKLAQELEVSHTAAYRHFSSKEELLAAIFLETSNGFKQALAGSIQPGCDGQEALVQLGLAYVHFFLENPEALSLFSVLPEDQNALASLFSAMDPASPLASQMIEVGCHADCGNMEDLPVDSAFGIFRGMVQAICNSEAYRHLSEREVLLGFWSKVHGLATLLVTQKKIPEARRYGCQH